MLIPHAGIVSPAQKNARHQGLTHSPRGLSDQLGSEKAIDRGQSDCPLLAVRMQ